MGATETIKRNIINILKKVGVKQKDAAVQTNISPTYFSRMLLSGKWQIRHLEALANFLQIPLWQLFYEEADVEEFAPDILILQSGKRPVLVNLFNYVNVPIVKLHVEMDFAGAEVPQQSLGTMYVNKDMAEKMSVGKVAYAVEITVRAKE